MIIAHVLSSFGVGGQERVALDLAAAQLARGHQVIAVSLAPPPEGALADEFRAVGAEVIAVPKRPGTDLTLVPRLAWALRRRKVEVVHSHNPLPLIYGAPAARLVGAVAIHTKHGVNPGSRGHRLLRRQAARLVSAFVAVSTVTAQQAREQRDCEERQLVVIPNGIRLERFAPDPVARAAVRAELGIGADAMVVGTVGRIDEYKNQGLLLAAIAPRLGPGRLAYREGDPSGPALEPSASPNPLHALGLSTNPPDSSGPGVHVVFVGDGPTRAALEAAVAAAPGARFAHVLGRRMDVARLLPAFDVFALSSKSEGLPLVVPEAMAAGLPVVTTAVGGLPTVIDDGETGYLTAVDERAFAAALAKLIDDPAAARSMGLRARAVALGRYSAERMCDDYLALYQRALRR